MTSLVAFNSTEGFTVTGSIAKIANMVLQ